MNTNTTKKIAVTTVLLLSIAGVVGWGLQKYLSDAAHDARGPLISDSSTNSDIDTTDKSAAVDLARNELSEANPEEPAGDKVEIVKSDVEPIEGGDDGNAENPEEILVATQLSASEEQTDFQMMNPELAGREANAPEPFELVVSPVNWDDAQQHEPLPDSLLTAEQSSVVEQSPVPVMLPPKESLLTDGLLTIGDTWYAASLNEPGVSVLVEGSNVSVKLPEDVSGAIVGTLDSYAVNRDMGMVEVALNAFGVTYTVTVECADQSDSACVDDVYITELVESLLLANKKGESDGA